MPSKIRIKMGPIELEHDGSEAFPKEEILGLLSSVCDLYKTMAGVPGFSPSIKTKEADDGGEKIQGTTSTIAAKLKVDSGPDLILAACARLAFVAGQTSSSRKKILEEMKTAKAYYKPSYASNLSSYLEKLVKDETLNEPTDGHYVLTQSTRTDLEKRLAQ